LNRATDQKRAKQYAELGHPELYAPLGPSWNVGLLAVSPRHQRRGVGGKLLKYIQDIATEENLPITLEASVAGQGLYLKSGFKVINETEIAEGLFDVDMVWEPEHLKGKFLEKTEDGKFKIKNPK
jgi:GNAT superfamily N-acetyltransferase